MKTLKDLETDSADLFTNYAVASDELKAEAVKWAKLARKQENKCLNQEDYKRAGYHGGVIMSFKTFFNLTEEDLQ